MKPDLMIIAPEGENSGASGSERPGAQDMKPGELCVPLKALATTDDGEEMVNPEEGDQVSFTAEGKVSRIEGDKAYVTPTAINGESIEEKEAKPEPDSSAEAQDAADYKALESEAQGMS